MDHPVFKMAIGPIDLRRGVSGNKPNVLCCLQVGVTEPRRVAATTLAARVAEEKGTGLGNAVGYRHGCQMDIAKF